MNLSKTLSWQLLKSVLSIYFSITLFITLAQMGTEYWHTRSMIQQELEGAQRTFYPALSTALWELNQEQMEALLQGIIDLPLISSVRVTDSGGHETVRGRDHGLIGAAIEHGFDVSYHFSGQDIQLANVTFVASDRVVLQRLQVGFQMIILSAMLKSLILSGLFVWTIRRRLGEPLELFTHTVRRLDLKSLGKTRLDLGLKHENELQHLQHAFNHMLATIEQERIAHDQELWRINEGLESEIARRTQELADANHRLEQLARTDTLTGLANRRHFMERFAVDVLRSQRNNSPLTLLALDLDHFKAINDRWGHDAGDEALRNFAQTATGQLRATDLLARLGGEEFAILLPDTNPTQALEVAERIRQAIGSQTLVSPQARFGYTVSIGLASLDPRQDDCHSLMKKADQAMYDAKQMGRNRVETWRATSQPGPMDKAFATLS